MSQSKVRKALETQLKTWGTANPTVKIVYEATANSNTDVKKVESKLIPAEMQNPSFGIGHERYTGTFRLLLKIQALTQGMGEIETLASSLQSAFPRGSQFTHSSLTTNIVSTPSVRPSYIDGMYTVVPVDISYRADVLSSLF